MSDRISQIRARLEAATPGPWTGAERGAWGGQGFVVAPTSNASEKDDTREWFCCEADTSSAAANALLLAAAPADLALLLKLVDVYERALGFYADDKHWLKDDIVGAKLCGVHEAVQYETDYGTEHDIDSQLDDGDTAKTALAEGARMKGEGV